MICAYPLSALRAPLRRLDAFAPPRRARPAAVTTADRRPPPEWRLSVHSSRVKHRLPARAGSLSHGLCVQERLQKLVLQRDSLPQRLPFLLPAELRRAVMSRPVLGSSYRYTSCVSGSAERICTLANCAPRPGVPGGAVRWAGRRIRVTWRIGWDASSFTR